MKLATTLVAAALQLKAINAFPNHRVSILNNTSRFHDPNPPIHHLLPRDTHDRGTWNMDCTKAQQACNNACWYISCLNRGDRMYYDPGNNNAENRKQSGCSAPENSICNLMPFSQKFNDPQPLSNPTCDEWPMAETKQQPYNERKPNSLRCINSTDNASGGSQLQNFLNLKVNQPGRIGDQPFEDGDYWTVDFNNINNSPYCQQHPTCDNDEFQFEMTKLGTGVNGEYSYDYEKENRYALNGNDARSGIDVAQCRVHLQRTSIETSGKLRRDPINSGADPTYIHQIKFDAEVFDYQGNSQGTESGIPTTEDPIILTGLTSLVKIYSTGDELTDNAKYVVDNVDWVSDKYGAGGEYCKVGDVNGDTQDEDCYFPCFVR